MLRFIRFFPLFNKFGFWGIFCPPYCGIGASIRINQEMLCLPYAGFFLATCVDLIQGGDEDQI